MYGKGLRGLSIVTCVALTGAFALAFFYAPMDADQGISQKIFYVHVPMAIVALLRVHRRRDLLDPAPAHRRPQLRPQVLRRDPPVADPRRRHAHHRVDLGRASWGHWWVWDEPTLVSFLIVFLLYCLLPAAALLDRGPGAPGPLRGVFAITAGAFVPLNFLAVRLAQRCPSAGARRRATACPARWRSCSMSRCSAMALLYVTLWKYEMAAKTRRACA